MSGRSRSHPALFLSLRRFQPIHWRQASARRGALRQFAKPRAKRSVHSSMIPPPTSLNLCVLASFPVSESGIASVFALGTSTSMLHLLPTHTSLSAHLCQQTADGTALDRTAAIPNEPSPISEHLLRPTAVPLAELRQLAPGLLVAMSYTYPVVLSSEVARVMPMPATLNGRPKSGPAARLGSLRKAAEWILRHQRKVQI